VRDIATRWTDRFDLRRRRRRRCASPRFPESYQSVFTPAEAYADLPASSPDAEIRSASPSTASRADQRPASVELKIFHAGEPVSLSRRVPVLENLGFASSASRPMTFEVTAATAASRRVWSCCTTWNWRTRDGRRSTWKIGPLLEEAFLVRLERVIEDDTFNR
jgi:glutamate dehydrogenase